MQESDGAAGPGPEGRAAMDEDETRAAPDGAPAAPAFEPLLYVHAVVVSALTAVVLMLWLALFYAVETALWENGFVESNRWMFPVICLPFSLAVGLLVKHLKAPTAMTESLTDSIAGDTSRIEWRRFPVSALQALVSLFSGAAVGPEGGLGLLASQVAAWYGHVLRIPAGRRPRLVYAGVASAYNGLLQNPLFTGVLGVELSETKAAGRTSLPANLIGGAVGYAVFLALGMPSLAGILGLEPVKYIRALDVLLILVTALLGIALAAVTAVLFKVATRVLGRFRDDVGRALAAGVVFSLAGAAAPILMFSGESQVQTVVEHPARYGAALLLVMALAKLALLAVAFRGGFLGGAIFPSIFALVCVALALDLVLPAADPTVLVAGMMVGFMVVMFRTPFMVILLTAFMLEASIDLLALIVLAVAAVLIVSPLLQRAAAKQTAPAEAPGGRDTG